MKIKFTKNFQKEFARLRQKEKDRVTASLNAFQINPDFPFLQRHALKGEFLGYMSINAGGDLRLLYYEEDDKITFVFVRVGSHSQLYG